MFQRMQHFFSVGVIFALAASFFLSASFNSVQAQVVQSVVGGVAIEEGLLRNATKEENATLSKEMAALVQVIPDDLDKEAPLRKISLKKLNAEMRQCIDQRRDFSPAMCFLGGLTSIHYVVAVPEENDVLLIGPAEGWKVDLTGNVVGKKTGAPILLLQDLITVFRAWNIDRPPVITCSIDPTPEAVAKMRRIESVSARPGEQRALAHAMEQANGNHVVEINGVPRDSRFARLLVAADYKMKQIGLGHETAPISGIKSYVSYINPSTRHTSVTPRFWFAPEYETITFDSKKQVWHLGPVKVKTLTEDQYTDSRTNTRRASGRTDVAAQRWCDAMNRHFNKLADRDPTFGELKNCMQIALSVALIHREGLLETAQCKLPTFTENAFLKLPVYSVPRFVAAKSIIHGNIVACGGVEINPWDTVEKPMLDNKLDKLAKNLTAPTQETWYADVK